MMMKLNFYVSKLLFLLASASLMAQGADVIYEQNVSSTVTIYTDAGQGSGFFVSPNIIATNYHVIDGAYEVNFKMAGDDTYYECDVIDYDVDHDLALCRTTLNRRSVKFARSAVRIGQQLFVIGSPVGLEATFSDGRVSNIWETEGFFQMTAAISPGSSGGPVFNDKGELIGVSTATNTRGQNLNLAVPITYLQDLMVSSGIMNSSAKSSQGNGTGSYSPRQKSDFTYNKSDYGYEVFLAREDNLALSLDYFTNIENSTCLYFNYEPHGKDKITIKAGDVFIRDRITGAEFPCKYNEIKSDSRTVYPGTSTRFCLCTGQLPDQVISFDIIEKNGSGLLNMYNLQMDHFQMTDREDYLSYISRKGEGTIAFYSASPCGDIEIIVDGKYVGTLTEYFTDGRSSYPCGIESNAMLNLRLPLGNYSFEARCEGTVWTGDFTITEDCCKTIKIPD